MFGVQHFSDDQHLPTQKHVRFGFRVAQNSPQKQGDLHRGAEEFGGGARKSISREALESFNKTSQGDSMVWIEFLEMLLGLMIFQKYL